MKRKLFALLLVAGIAIVFIPGCGSSSSDNNPTDGGSSAGSLSDHAGANEVVTESNVDEVTAEVNAIAWDVFGRAMSASSYGKAAIDQTINLNGDVNGKKSGKATVQGKIVIKETGITVTGYDYDFAGIFYDFSDDGELYLGGSLTYKGSLKYSNNIPDNYTISIKGGLTFNGTYSGTEDYSATIKMDSAGNVTYDGTVTVTSGGKTFTHSFKY